MGEREADIRPEMAGRSPKIGSGTAENKGVARQAPTARNGTAGDELPCLLELALRRENMLAAYKRVVKNGGAPGVDGMTVEELKPYCQLHWARIRQEILSGTYLPKPVRKVEIPKPDGKGTRMLGIPCVFDRMIQQAIHQVLSPMYEVTFSDSSYGFRPGRSAHQAVAQSRDHIRSGYDWVVDVDLEKFFDRVNHDVLMALLARRVEDRRLLLLIRRYLQAGIMEGGVVSPRVEGTPQGGPLSPLLSNILLDELDKLLEARGHHFCRYADDCNVYVKSKAAGERVLASLERFLQKRLRLRINRDKSAVDRPWKRKFLGYTVTATRKSRLKVAPESVKRLKTKLRQLFRTGRGQSLKKVFTLLRPVIQGWTAYFRMSEVKETFQLLDKWLRHRARVLLWRRWKRTKTRLKELCRRGITMDEARLCACNRLGPWRNSGSKQMNLAVPTRWLQSQGLVSFLETHAKLALSQ